MPAEDVNSAGGGFLGRMQQGHMRFVQPAAALVMIAGGTGGDHVCPYVQSTQVTRQDVINRQFRDMPAAILANVIVAAEYFPSG